MADHAEQTRPQSQPQPQAQAQSRQAAPTPTTAMAEMRGAGDLAAIGLALNNSPRVVAQRALAQRLTAAAARRHAPLRARGGDAPVIQMRPVKIYSGETIETRNCTKEQLEEHLEWENDAAAKGELEAAIANGEYADRAAAAINAALPAAPPPPAAAPAAPGAARGPAPAFLADLGPDQMARLRAHPAAAPIPDFASDTVGVEQELVGRYRISIADELRGTVGTVSRRDETLVYFTTDMGSNRDYTIELKTTPCAHDDAEALAARQRALHVMYEAIKRAGAAQEGVTSQADGDCVIHILKKHRIMKDAGFGAGFGNQVSIGMKTSDLIRPDRENKHFPLVTQTWFDPELSDGLAPDDLEQPDVARQAYALVASVIAFINQLSAPAAKAGAAASSSSSSSGDAASVRPELAALNRPDIKNQWSALPRTPPWDWLKPLGAGDRAIVTAALTDRYGETVGLDLVREGQSLGSHPIPPFTIQGEQGSVFEIRSPDQKLGKYLYEEAQ